MENVNQQIELKIRMLYDGLAKPRYAHHNDNGLDLRSRIDVVIGGGERAIVPTGVAMEIPEGWAGLLVPRSGLAAQKGVSIVNSPGIIDAGYRGEIDAVILNTSKEAFQVVTGDRICQLVLVQAPQATLVYVNDLGDSARGTRGKGSTGVL